MHSPVSAIHAGLVRPRFAPALPRHRERQLGLTRRTRIAAAGGGGVPLHPRAALRAAARSLVRPLASQRPVTLNLRRGSRVSWTRRTVEGLRAVREGSAAAWRA